MTTTTATRLNATLEVAPESVTRWAVTKIRKWRGMEGQGYEATVTLDGQPAGAFVNEGTGGGTWLQPANGGVRDAIEALSREWAQVNPGTVWLPTVTVNADGSQSEPEQLASEEHICDSIVENYNLAKKLDGIVKRGKTPVLTREQVDAADDGGEYGVEFGIKGYGTISGPMTDPGVRAAIVKHGIALVWQDRAWTTP